MYFPRRNWILRGIAQFTVCAVYFPRKNGILRGIAQFTVWVVYFPRRNWILRWNSSLYSVLCIFTEGTESLVEWGGGGGSYCSVSYNPPTRVGANYRFCIFAKIGWIVWNYLFATVQILRHFLRNWNFAKYFCPIHPLQCEDAPVTLGLHVHCKENSLQFLVLQFSRRPTTVQVCRWLA